MESKITFFLDMKKIRKQQFDNRTAVNRRKVDVVDLSSDYALIPEK